MKVQLDHRTDHPFGDKLSLPASLGSTARGLRMEEKLETQLGEGYSIFKRRSATMFAGLLQKFASNH